MSQSVRRVVILVASLLSACGGGGGGGGGGSSSGGGNGPGNSPLPDPGDSSPVVVYAGSSVGANLTSAVAPRMVDHLVLLTLAAHHLGARVGPGVFSALSTGGACYGSPRGTRNSDGTGWVEAELIGCGASTGLSWSGKVIHRVHTVAAGVPSNQSWTFPGATLRYDGATYTLSGRLRRLDTASSVEYSSNFTLRDEASGNVFGADELTWRSVTSAETTLSPSGRLRDADVGFVDISNGLPLTLKGNERGFRAGGYVELAGSASSAWFVPVTDKSVAVALHRTGAAETSQSVLLNADTRLAPQLATPGTALLGAAAGPSQNLEQGKPFRLQGLFSGAGSRRWITLTWKMAMVPPGSLAASNQFSGPYPAFTPDGPGTYTFELTATDGVNTTHDSVTHKVLFAGDDPLYYPAVSASSTGTYLGPDGPIDGTAIAAPAALTAFSTSALGTSQSLFDYEVWDPTRRSLVSAQVVAPDVDFPTAGLGLPGFYFQSLGMSTDPGRGARRYFAYQQPLQYFRTSGLRVENPGLGIAAADLSAAGRKDIIMTGLKPLAGGSTRGVFVIRKIEPGRYAAPEFIAGGNAGAVTVGDFTGDGRPDIVLDAGSSNIDLLAQLPGGAWAPAQRLHPASMNCPPMNDTRARPLLQADFDGDGRRDIAYSAVCAGSNVAVFFQNGDGTFAEHVIPNADAIYEGRLLAADVTGDGRSDLIVVAGPPDTSSAAHVDVYASRTDRTFEPAVIQTVLSEPFTFAARSGAAGDYDGDGDTDILMSSPNGLFLFRQAAGTLTPGVQVGSTLRATWADPLTTDFDFWIQEMSLMDIDGDGRLDVVERTRSSGFYPLSVLLQRPDGSLQAPRALFATDGFGHAATLPVLLDENLDSLPDLLYVGTHEGDRGDSAGGVTVVHQRPH